MRAAVIGLGRIGFEFGLEKGRQQPASHFACYQTIPEITELAACDSDPKKLELIPKKYTTYLDINKLCEEFQPEVVSICTPTNTHAEIACEAAEYSSVQSIFVEKPIAQSIEEAQRIIAVCNHHHVKLTVNHQRRWESVYRVVQNCKPVTAIGIHHGPLLRSGIHMLDLFNWIIRSAPITAQAFGKLRRNYITEMPASAGIMTDFNLNGVINYQDDTEAIFISGEQKPYVLFELDLLGDKGRMHVTENGDKLYGWKAYPSDRYSGLIELKQDFTYYSRFMSVGAPPPLQRAIEEVISPIGNSCTGEDATLALRVALSIHYSACHNYQPVQLADLPKDWKVGSY